MMEFLKAFRLSVFDERIGPTDTLYFGCDIYIVKVLDAGCAEAVHEHVILEGADDLRMASYFFEEVGIKRFDKARVD